MNLELLASLLAQLIIVVHVGRTLATLSKFFYQACKGDVESINAIWHGKQSLTRTILFFNCTAYPAFLLGWYSVVLILTVALVYDLLQPILARKTMLRLIRAGGGGMAF